MTTAQHLWEAQKTTPEIGDISLAMRHLSAIPPNAPEAREAKVVRAALEQRRAVLDAAEMRRQSALADKQSETKTATDTRDQVVSDLGVELRNLGYDLKVNTNSDVPEEVVITSSEFDDTDHRVRFLSFMRGRNSPASRACVSGFSKIRLRSSQIPFVGFDESYSLNCFSWWVVWEAPVANGLGRTTTL
jgi:hypothetical protein